MSKALERRLVGRMNKEVTFLGFGALEIGRDWGIGSETERPNEQTAGILLNEVLDLGITLIDTASAYHASEERIGKSIASRRSQYVLASKAGEHNQYPGTYYDFSYKAIKESIDRSLMLLNTDYIDILQIHFGPDPQKVLHDGETVAAMKDAKKEGKIGHLGASIDGELAKQCILSDDFDIMQLEYNLLNVHNDENIRLAHERGIGVFIRGGLGYGRLTSRVLPQVAKDPASNAQVMKLLELVGGDADRLTALALQFLHRKEGITSILAGTKNIHHLRANFELLEVDFKDSVWQAVDEIANHAK
ncbi:aldo/keto reductase [Paenibacillus spongiae]|uniref:Aldo/keto reductase n=1 Tax=Paenibacillus spongiae TaxID=2909671 RepID=A0ABY5SHF2_9BACL|nr:aldo/keto reductase [Paenibacillus spongiae]UVI33414.1 aldo/keto reductase [Paenibacillus spongiae]